MILTKRYIAIFICILCIILSFFLPKKTTSITRIHFDIQTDSTLQIELSLFENYLYTGKINKLNYIINANKDYQPVDLIIPSDKTGPVTTSYRIDFGPVYPNSIYLKNVTIYFSDNTIKTYKPRNFRKSIHYTSDKITGVYSNNNILFTTTHKTEGFNPYFESTLFNYSFYKGYIQLTFIIILFLLLIYPAFKNSFLSIVIIYKKNKWHENSWLLITIITGLSFFSSTIINNYSIATWAIFSLILILKNGYVINKNLLPISMLLIIFLFLKILTCFLSGNLSSSSFLSFIENKLPFLLIPILFLFLPFPVLSFRYIGLFYILIACCLVINTIYSLLYGFFFFQIPIHSYFASITEMPGPLFFFFPGFNHALYIGLFLTIGIIIAIKLFSENFINIYLLFLITILTSIFTYLASVRINIILIPLVFFLYSFYRYISKINKSKQWIAHGLLLTGFFISIFILLITIQHMDPARYQLWKTTKTAITQNNSFLTGVKNYKNIFNNEQFAKTAGFNKPTLFNNAHNQFFQEILESGLIVALLLIAIIFYLLYYAIKTNSYLLYAYTYTWLIFMNIEVPLNRSRGLLFFLFFLYLILIDKEKETTLQQP